MFAPAWLYFNDDKKFILKTIFGKAIAITIIISSQPLFNCVPASIRIPLTKSQPDCERLPAS